MNQTDFRNQAARDDDLTRRVLDRLAGEQAEIDRQEQAAAAARERETWGQLYAAQDQTEAQAVKRLAGLRPQYEARRAAAEKAAAALAEFCKIEYGLRNELSEIDERLRPVWNRTVPVAKRSERFRELRNRAGLSEHAGIGIPGAAGDPARRTALTAITGIIAGLVGAGSVQVGGKLFRFDVESKI